MNFSERVKQRRLELNMTQEELALKMGYKSKSSINKIECGRPVTQKIIVKLADALETTPSYLLGWIVEEEIELSKEIEPINAKEDAELLTIFHQLSATDKERLIQMAKLLL